MTDIVTLNRQLSSTSVWHSHFADIQCVFLSSAHLTQASEFPYTPLLLYCEQNHFHINLDQKSRKLKQLQKNTHMNSMARQT